MYAITWFLIGIYSNKYCRRRNSAITVCYYASKLHFLLSRLHLLYECRYRNRSNTYSTHLSDDNHNHLLALLIIGSLKSFLRGNWQNYLFVIFPAYNLSSILKRVIIKYTYTQKNNPE